MNRIDRIRFSVTGISLALLLSAAFAPAADAKDRSVPTPTDNRLSVPKTFQAPGTPPELPEGYLIGGDDFSAEFLPEGVIWRWEPGNEQFAFWIVEVRGSRGQFFWTRSKKSLYFGLNGDRVEYRRTPLISEMYEGNRDEITQIWHFLDNPVWEGGDLTITGEILTTLGVREEEGRIQFYDVKNEWLGPFFRMQATDEAGRVLELTPELDGKTVTLTVPATWLYEVGTVQVGGD